MNPLRGHIAWLRRRLWIRGCLFMMGAEAQSVEFDWPERAA